MGRFKIVVTDIRTRKNLDIYSTLRLAIIISVLGAFGVASVPVVISAVLAVLALISFSFLLNREHTERLQQSLNHLDISPYLTGASEWPLRLPNEI